MLSSRNHGWGKARARFALFAGACLLAVPAYAQDAADAGGDEDGNAIIVTAQKREQDIQDTSLSISALGESALASLGNQDITAIAAQVPSLQANQYSPTITVFNIRGVAQNDFADNQEAPIAFYNDEVYVSALGAISGQTYDLDRIEVLRGPQGTLFGRNATGGLVQIVTAKPSDSLEAFARLTVGEHNQIVGEAAVGGPLSDRVRGRLSLYTGHNDGYIDNDIGSDRGGQEFYAGRLQLEADVGSSGELWVKIQGMKNERESSAGAYTHLAAFPDADGLGVPLPADIDFWGTCAGCDPFGYRDADGDPFTGSFDQDSRFDREYFSATVRYEHRFAAFDLVSITDYQSLDKAYLEDSDMGPSPIFVYATGQDVWQASQELRLSGETDTLNWLVGAYGLMIRSDNNYAFDILAGDPAFGFSAEYGGRQETDSLAVFAQAGYEISPVIELILGARYSWDWKTYDYRTTNILYDGTPPYSEAFNRQLFPDLAEQTFDNYSLKAQIDVRPADDVLLYAGVNRGTKSGGFGVPSVIPISPSAIPFDEEVLTSYEAGFKATVLPDLNLNGSVFHYDYDDYQTFLNDGLNQNIENYDATVDGFEVELFAEPIRGFSVSAFVTHLDTNIEDLVLPSGRVVDRELPQAPKWTFGGSAELVLPVGGGELAFQADFKHNFAQFFSSYNAPIDREPAYTVLNARISYTTAGDRLEFAAFAKNLTDEEYRVYSLDLTGSFGFANATYARPQWFGGSVTVRY